MAYNPYEYRDNREGVVGKTLKAPYRFGRGALRTLPTWAPNVAAGQGVRVMKGAYDSAYGKMRKAVGIRKSAYAAMQNDAGVRAAKDAAFYAKRAAANRLPGLNRAVDAATSSVQSAAELKRAAFDNLSRVSRQGRQMVRTVAAQTGEAIEAGSRKLAGRGAVVSVGDNTARARTLQQIRAGANRQLSETVSAANNMVRAAKRDTRVARGMFNTALQRKTAAVDALNKVNAGVRQAENAVGTAINAARDTRRATIAAAHSFTRTEKAALGVANAYKTSTAAVKGVAKSVVGSAADMAKNVLRAVNPLGSKEAVSAALGKSGTVLTGGAKTAKAIGNWALVKPAGSVAKAGKFIAGAPVKGIAGAFNAIEKVGQIATAGNTGRAAKFVRGATSAGSLAGAFAFQAWSDAAEEAYKFYAEGGKLSDVGKQKIETINGKQVAMRNPGWADIIFSRDFAKGVLKGTQSALTLGLTGKGDDTFFDHVFEEDPEEANKRLNAQLDPAQLRDIHGNSVYTAEQLNKMQTALASAAARTKMEQDFVKRATGTLDVQNFRKMLGDITAEKAATMQKMEDNIANFSEFSKTLRGGVKTEDGYRQAVTANAEKTYERRMKMLLGNKAAKDVMDENRRAAYAHSGVFGSGDYDADVKNAAHASDLREFNKMWNDLSDADRVSWNKEDADRAVAEAEAEYEKANPPKPAEEEAA